MRSVLIAAVAAMLPVYVHGADISVTTSTNGSTIIYVVGDFQLGDEKRFAEISASQAFVSFRSPGGNAIAGMAISETIRNRGFITYVASGATCASACGIAWLGGKRRVMSANAQIGFHAAYRKTAYGTTEDSGVTNAVLGGFLTKELELPLEAVIYVTRESGPNNLEWLNPDDARKVGITVEQQEWQIVPPGLSARYQPPAPPQTYGGAYDAPAPPVYSVPPPPVVYQSPPMVIYPPMYRGGGYRAPAPYYRRYR